ncbi:MAG: M15 family metallopeptidase [Paracoccaceae bacterium]|uniref:M15 family metallopeptidase n=1 Tax=Sedimentitalea sp. TaxID=2048915 RepID=UPI0032644F52
MAIYDNYREKTFLVSDPDARVRSTGDIWAFLTYAATDDIPAGSVVGDYILIPKETTVSVRDVRIVPAGKRNRFFADVEDAVSGRHFGWTATTNFQGAFRNVTLGKIDPESGAGRYAETAAWSRGDYVGQVALVKIVDAGLELENLTQDTIEPYFAMVQAAAADSIVIVINSGFRTYAAQKYLYDNWKKGVTGFNLAAKPGHSNHQNGTALDIPVSGGPGLPVYDWLAVHATSFGFVRTVKSEYWHWEYRPSDAAEAKTRNAHTLWD